MNWPDVETALLDWLEAEIVALAPGGFRHVDTETPVDLVAALPFVRVGLVTGRDDGISDFSLVDIEVFAASRALAYALAEDIRARLVGGRVGTVIIDRVVTLEKPRPLPWVDGNVRRYGATYRLSARR